MINWGKVPLGSVIPFFFDAFDGGTGASMTLTGLAITDVEIYKGNSMTQRTSDSGVVLLDTDGIDVDGITGIHGFSIDTGDNADAGFFVAGSFYTVVVASVTIDAQTVNFVAGTFWLGPAVTAAGVDEVDVTHWLGQAVAAVTVNGVPEVDVTHWRGTAAPAEDTAGYPKVTIKDGTGTGEIDTASGRVAITEGQIDQIVDEILDEDMTAHQATGTLGSTIGDNAASGITGWEILFAMSGWPGVTLPSAAQNADAVWDEAKSGHVAAGSFGQALQVIRSGTAQGGDATHITLDAGASAVDDYYNGLVVMIVGGTGEGQFKPIDDYVGATKIALVTTWLTTPDSTSKFAIVGV